MKVLKEFAIPFVGLKEGIHEFTFEIDGKFFESFEYSEINDGRVNAYITLDRKERMLIFDFVLNGHVVIPCDRCLEDLDYPVKVDERLIVKFGQEFREETEEILIIPEKESHIDISSYIYEYVMLSLPLKKVHPEDENACNPEIIAKLDQHGSPEIDPRWEALKNLKGNKE